MLVDASAEQRDHENLPAVHRPLACTSAIWFTRKSGWSCAFRSPTTSTFSATCSTGSRNKNRWFRDFTLDALARAVRETIACFPVYRTYLAPGRPVSEEDRAVIERAVAAAKRRNPALEESVFNFLRDILLFRFPENLDEEARDGARAFRSEIPADAPGRSWRRDWRIRSSTSTTGWRR